MNSTFTNTITLKRRTFIIIILVLSFNSSLPADDPISDRVRSLEERIAELEKQEPIEIKVIQLRFIETGPQNLSSSSDKAWLRIHLRVTNRMGRTTQAIAGELIFNDPVGVPWWKIALDVQQTLYPDISVDWIGRVNYDELSDAHKRARQTLANEVRAEIELNTVLFLDGSELSFREKNNIKR